MKGQKRTRKQKQYCIAMVCDFFYPRLGGVEMHIWSLSQHLLRLGHKVIVLTHAYDNRKGVRYFPGPLKVYYCPIFPMTDQDALPTLTATFSLWRHIMIREGVNVVHTHQATSVLANESLVYASALGIPTVYTDHSLFGLNDVAGVVLNRVLQTTLSTVNAAIGVSHACRDNLVLRAQLQGDRVCVIPNAVDPSLFTPDPQQRPVDRIQIVVISRLVYRKGVDLLVGLIPQICRHYPNVDFVIGGDGNKLLDLQEMLERERLQDRVECLGAVPHVQVVNVLRRGHVFVNCSLTESFCIALLEAASCGLLVVSTNVGGVPEVLPPSKYNILCEPTVEGLVEGVKQAVTRQSNPQTALDPIKAHEELSTMYSWQSVAKKTVKVYDRILQEPPKSFATRLHQCYYASLGGFSGLVACFLACYIELWIRIVIWWQPASTIDVVSNLIPPPGDDASFKKDA